MLMPELFVVYKAQALRACALLGGTFQVVATYQIDGQQLALLDANGKTLVPFTK